MMACGKTTKPKARESIQIQKARATKVSGEKTSSMAMASKPGRRALGMKATTCSVKRRARASILGQMVRPMKASGSITKLTDSASTYGRTGGSTTASGRATIWQEWAFTSTQTA
jgi:hypothetical protein